jgi:hypothetical protein
MQVYRLPIHLPSRKTWLSLTFLCLVLTILDIVVVESHYRPLQAWDRIWVWHGIYRTIFVLIPLLVSYVLKSFVPLATWFFFLFGLEDTLFYALQGYLPVQYPGISILGVWEPTLAFVLQINLLGIASIFAFALCGLDHYGLNRPSLQRVHT